MESNNLQRYSLPRQVADRLEKKIGEGVYQVGEKIPTETELMQEFNVSRNTVREAIKGLVSSGVLMVRQGDGTYVKSKDRFSANMSQKLAQVSLAEIAEARNVLEVSIAYLAAQRRTDSDLAYILDRLHNRSISGEIKENTKADVEFHMAIAKACHNNIVYDLYRSLFNYLEDQIAERHLDTELDNEVIDNLHEDLFKAIEEKDSEKARLCAERILNI